MSPELDLRTSFCGRCRRGVTDSALGFGVPSTGDVLTAAELEADASVSDNVTAGSMGHAAGDDSAVLDVDEILADRGSVNALLTCRGVDDPEVPVETELAVLPNVDATPAL